METRKQFLILYKVKYAGFDLKVTTEAGFKKTLSFQREVVKKIASDFCVSPAQCDGCNQNDAISKDEDTVTPNGNLVQLENN